MAFSSADSLDGPPSVQAEIYLRDRTLGTTERISLTPAGTTIDQTPQDPNLSANGNVIVFRSFASDLTSGDVNGKNDVFAYDRMTGSTELISRGPAGVGADNNSSQPSVSGNGQIVAFSSLARNLISGIQSPQSQLYAYDRATGVIENLSGLSGSTQQAGNFYPDLSFDGNLVAFLSGHSDLSPMDGATDGDIFVADRAAGTIEMISVSSDGIGGLGEASFPSISDDGRYVVYQSDQSTLIGGDTNGVNDIFIRDRIAETTERVSVASDGAQANGPSVHPSISNDGRYVTFESSASNLIADDTNAQADIFVHDRFSGETRRLNNGLNGAETDLDSRMPEISGDGSLVVFSSQASNLVPDDMPTTQNIFAVGVTEPEPPQQIRNLEYISPSINGPQAGGGAFSYVSENGRFVAFQSNRQDLTSDITNNVFDIFVRDRQTEQTQRISISDTGGETSVNSDRASISGDGRYVVFDSGADNLIPGDTNGSLDVFMYDRQEGALSRISTNALGEEAIGFSSDGHISADGKLVTFVSGAINLVADDDNGNVDIFVKDLQSGLVERINLTASGDNPNNSSFEPYLPGS